MITIPFWKVESVGNDFVLVHLEAIEQAAAYVSVEIEQRELLTAGAAREEAGCFAVPLETPSAEHGLDTDGLLQHLAIRSCERRFGIGSDGLLAVAPRVGGIVMRMFNPDGTEDFCGNGMRCAAVHVLRQGWVGQSFSILHGGRDVATREEADGSISTVIGLASYDPSHVPVISQTELFNTEIWSEEGRSILGSSLTTGSTHTILQVGQLPDDTLFERVSRQLEHDARFPDRTSIIWTREAAPDRLEVRIWERGVGETLGCGTGASAATADYLRRQGRGGQVEVVSRGGTVTVTADAWNTPLTAQSFAKELFQGEYRLALG